MQIMVRSVFGNNTVWQYALCFFNVKKRIRKEKKQMAVSLTKGQKVSLSKEHPGLTKVIAGLGWESANRNSKKGFFSRIFSSMIEETIDCDSSVFLLKNGKLQNEEDIIWYHHLTHPTKAVIHQGDNLIGSSGKKDDEQILVDLNKLPPEYDRLVIVVNIYRAREKQQHFGKVRNAYIRLVNSTNHQELYRYDLTEDYDGCTAMIFSELYRHHGEWKFSAIGQGTNDGTIAELADRYR